MKINTIIFDLGGVLIDWNPEYVFQHVIPDEDKRRYFFEHICTYSWNIEQDAGRTLHDATELKIAEFPDWENEIRAYYGRWTEMLGEAIHGTVEILRSLIDDPNYRVYALTNWSNETFPIAKERFDFLHWFEGIVVSGDEKTRKPFPIIYETLLERYNVKAHEAVFIDDAFHNVEAANALGINGIHFQSPEQLRESLKALQVNVKKV
jgi:2-haloacid dehalogenase